jgi:hypothetical protein
MNLHTRVGSTRAASCRRGGVRGSVCVRRPDVKPLAGVDWCACGNACANKSTEKVQEFLYFSDNPNRIPKLGGNYRENPNRARRIVQEFLYFPTEIALHFCTILTVWSVREKSTEQSIEQRVTKAIEKIHAFLY